jgi:flagellin
MGLRINTNVQAMAAQRALETNYRLQNSALEKLASGSRINRSGDDAAGLAISEKLKSSIRSLKQANRNANDGISMIQTAEGAMNEIGNIVTRLRELSIQASSDTIGDTERSYIDKEVQQLKSEVNRITKTTEFNGRKLLDGSSDQIEVQIGIKNNPLEDRMVYDPGQQNVTLAALGLENVGTMSKHTAQENLAQLDEAINRLSSNRSDLGALQNRLQSTINNLGTYTENLSAANSRIRDTDMAEETSNLVKQNILTQTNVAMLGQANQTPQLALKLLG